MAEIRYGSQPDRRWKPTTTIIVVLIAVGFVAAVILASVAIAWYNRSRAEHVEVVYVFADPPGEKAAEPAAATLAALQKRAKLFRDLYHIDRATVRSDRPGEFRLVLYSRADPRPFYEELVRPGVFELRRVADGEPAEAAAETGTPPAGFDWATLRAWQFVDKKMNLELEEERILLKREPEMTVRQVKSAKTVRLAGSKPVWGLNLEFDKSDADAFARVTGGCIHHRLAAVMDGEVLTAPRVESEIKDGRVQIAYFRDEQEVKRIAAMLNSGALPMAVRIENVETVKKGSGS